MERHTSRCVFGIIFKKDYERERKNQQTDRQNYILAWAEKRMKMKTGRKKI